MDVAFVGLLGTAIGAIASFAGTASSNWLSLKKEREARQSQHKADFLKWEREQVQNGLLQATALMNLYITKYMGKSLEQAQVDPEIVNLSADIKKWLIAALMSYPNKEIGEYRALLQNLHEANSKAIIEEKYAWDIRQLLIDLAVAYTAFLATPWSQESNQVS